MLNFSYNIVTNQVKSHNIDVHSKHCYLPGTSSFSIDLYNFCMVRTIDLCDEDNVVRVHKGNYIPSLRADQSIPFMQSQFSAFVVHNWVDLFYYIRKISTLTFEWILLFHHQLLSIPCSTISVVHQCSISTVDLIKTVFKCKYLFSIPTCHYIISFIRCGS